MKDTLGKLNLALRSQAECLRPGYSRGRHRVVVCGMPKSGTTAIARLLGAATGATVCNDPFHRLDRLGVEFRAALFDGQLPLSDLWNAHEPVFRGRVIKDPNFPLLLDQVVQMLPEARYVALFRDPRDNIRSLLNRVGLPGRPEQADVDQVSGATWRRVLAGKDPAMPGDNYVEVLAWRWRRSAENMLAAGDRCVRVRYEDFMADKVSSITRLVTELNLSRKQAIDNLVDVQYQPHGDRTVTWDAFFGRPMLERIEEICGPQMELLDYEKTGNL